MGPVKNHRWIYACAKQLLERVLDALWKSEGFRFSVIRPFNFVGPRIDYLPTEEAGNPRVFSHFMDSLLYGDEPDQAGRWRRSLPRLHLHRRRRRLHRPHHRGQEQQLRRPDLQHRPTRQRAQDQGDSLSRCATSSTRNSARKAIRPRPEIISISGEEFYGKGYEDCDRRIANIDKARNLLGWDPKYGIDEVITKTMEYFVNEHRKKQAAAAAGAETANV